VSQALAGVSEQQLLHMVTFDPNRTPNQPVAATRDRGK